MIEIGFALTLLLVLTGSVALFWPIRPFLRSVDDVGALVAMVVAAVVGASLGVVVVSGIKAALAGDGI